jgi:hypothetical protein
MDAFFQEHRESFIKQVNGFKSSRDHAKNDSGESGGDTLIAARVRPLLSKEIAENEVAGITVRSESGCADVHELRRKVNGQPSLSVSGPFVGEERNNSDLSCSHQASDSTKSIVLIIPRRMSTKTLLHHWYHGRGAGESALSLHTDKLDPERHIV